MVTRRFFVLLLFTSVPISSFAEDAVTLQHRAAFDGRTHTSFAWTIPDLTALASGRDITDCGPFVLEAQLKRERGLGDQMRMLVHLKADQMNDVVFSFERTLSPDRYQLELKLYDCEDKPLAEHRQEVEVIREPPGADMRLDKPRDEMKTGRARVRARVTGDIERVDFLMDGKVVGSSKRKPWEAGIRLGKKLKRHDVIAKAYNKAGAVVAQDKMTINRGIYTTAVTLIDVPEQHSQGGLVRVRTQMHMPENRELDRLEFFVDDQPVLAVFDPEVPSVMLPLPKTNKPFPVRVLARLMDGMEAEDSFIVNKPANLQGLEIRNIDLYVSVTNRGNMPVTGLSPEAFTIREDGKEMEITDFVPASEETLNMLFLMDVSGSMDPYITNVANGVVDMLRTQVRSNDRAGLVMFRDNDLLAIPFTGDKTGILRQMDETLQEMGPMTSGVSGIHDGIVRALNMFDGVDGRRVIVLFTDGFDSGSYTNFKEMVAFARRSEARVYLFHMDPTQGRMQQFQRQNPQRDMLRTQWTLLPEETGGRYYRVIGNRQLPKLFQVMEGDMRFQYLIRYETSRDLDDTDCRKVSVKLNRKDLRISTSKGWCP